MTRLQEKEKVMLAAAKAQAEVAPKTGFAALVAATLASVRRAYARVAIARELRRLDPRLLNDIGVEPASISEVAAKTAAAIMPGVPSLGTLLFIGPGRRVALRRRRQSAMRELMSLDDRTLADIGLRRYDIPAIVRQMVQDEPAPAPVADADLVRPLRLWNRTRLTAKELNGLDDRTLNDIGLVRGDIDWVAQQLAQRSLGGAANANFAPKAA